MSSCYLSHAICYSYGADNKRILYSNRPIELQPQYQTMIF